ncbi:hypothetical protein EYC80_008459 [Monilinia laxa]|uniref:Cytochrome P450 n=1 Tax=Monilinia laxa TaxID=61186 RepID=A0A5N6JSX6_MONLA|nr:hypothetical protein EYC80_008459 [Monilinia laxa]
MMATNCLSPLLFTQLLLPCLKATAEASSPGVVRIVWTSSQYVDLQSPEGGFIISEVTTPTKDKAKSYGTSKIGNWFLGSEMAWRVGPDGIISITQNPGNMKTNLMRHAKWMYYAAYQILHKAKMGAPTELFAGFSTDISMEQKAGYVSPWGRVHEAPRKDLLAPLKTVKEGGNDRAKEFWDCIKMFTSEHLTLGLTQGLATTVLATITANFLRLIPVVQISPNEISFAHSQAWTDIFTIRPGHLPFPQDSIWWARQPSHPESLISAGPDDHARMRKLLHHGFTPRALKMQEPILQKYVALLVERMSERAMETSDGGVLNIVPWFNYTTFDIFGDLGFGESFDCLQKSLYHPWIALLFNSVKAAGFVIAARFYPWFEKLLIILIPKSLKKMQSDNFQQIKDNHNGTDKGSEGMSLEEIHVTFMILTIAGSETTATVLIVTALEQLEYPNAVIQEGKRLCPPVPVMLPRTVPEGRDTTSVSLQSWTLFRDPKCFYDASSFIPERWLPEATLPGSPYANDQKQAVQAFSVGSRIWMGRHLAWAELLLVLTRLLWAFDLEVAGQLLRWN